MDFRIADTFTGSLARLTGEEQKAVKTTAFDLQLDPEAWATLHSAEAAQANRSGLECSSYAWQVRRHRYPVWTAGSQGNLHLIPA